MTQSQFSRPLSAVEALVVRASIAVTLLSGRTFFEDHLGSSDKIKTREDIAELKSVVFKQVKEGGYAVFNACDVNAFKKAAIQHKAPKHH